jgi:class 3 adenylate cyclase/tetratricopeptide (TPR) repeat protein
MTCSFCGAPLPEQARFCPNCGAAVAPGEVEERKMVTVLFVDLVDSTGLAQRLDPERARDVISRFHAAAAEELLAHRGHPERFVGDAAMAVFGLPHVQEDDAVRAVRAGFAIRERTGRLGEALGLAEALAVHVGIETGEAATGAGPGGQLLVTGPVVNAAARLQSAAAPGEVLVGRTTHELTSGAVSYGEPRTVPAKGFQQGLEAFSAERLSVRSVRRTIPLVGRSAELGLLRGSLAHTVQGAHPHLVSVIGEPGIGKSRLADELVAGLEPPIRALTSRGRVVSGSATFAPVASIIGQIAGIEEGDAPARILERLRAAAHTWCAPDEADDCADRLASIFGVGNPLRDESLFVADVQGSAIALLDGLSREAPVVVVVEDAHELRPAMLDLVERLVGRRATEPRRLLVIAVARPELLEARSRWTSELPSHTIVRLDPLTETDAVELVRRASGERVGDVRAREIAARAGGNPFFIVETTGVLLRGADPTAGLPPTVRSVVAARLDALSPPLRELARRVSVFLYSFDLDEVAAVADAQAQQLGALEDAEILVQDERTGGWRFRHEMVRDVAYASLPKRERARLHESVARMLLERDQVAWAADHLERAAIAALDVDPSDRGPAARAVAALASAADRARRRSETRSALEYGRRALALAGDEGSWGAREAWILAGIGEARYWLGEFPGAIEALDRAVELAGDDDRVIAHALRFRGDIAINVEDDLEAAEAFFERSLAAAERLGDDRVMARTLLFAGWLDWNRERLREAERTWRRALELAERAGDRWAEVRILTALSINTANLGDVPGGTTLIEKAQALAEEMGDRMNVGVTVTQRARRLQEVGRLEESLAGLDRGVTIFEEIGARWDLADALAERGVTQRELGRLDEAERDLERALSIVEELGDRQQLSWMLRALSIVAERRGEPDRAATLRRRSDETRPRPMP